jgi:hypothetical protein
MFQLDEKSLPADVKGLTDQYDLSCRPPVLREFEEYILYFLRLDENNKLVRTKEENRVAFEEGWGNNLEKLRESAAEGFELALKPGYFRGSKFFRYNNELVVTDNLQLEYELFVIARLCIFHTWLTSAQTVCELGCGTCANLLLLSRVLPKAELIGFDWTMASGEIAKELSRKLNRPIFGRLLDMLEPDPMTVIPENAAILTIHAFEQLGRDFNKILELIIRSKPSIVVQYEPLFEFYDENNLLDHLALRYCKKRNYLEGYYSRLCQLEKENRVKIIAAWRPYLGGVLHESSLLVWKPVRGTQNG